MKPNTRAFYAESVGNPKNDVLDFEGISEIAHANNVPLVVDNTVTSPYLCHPLEWGADIVVHSATKFIGGHGTSIGGIIVDGGKFDYVASGRHPVFTEPDPSYHGLDLLAAARAAAAGAVHPQGPAPAPARHRRGGVAVQRVPLHPGARDAQPAHGAALHERARGRRVARGARRRRVGRVPGSRVEPVEEPAPTKYLPRGNGAILAFGIKGGLEAGKRFVDGLELFSHLANVGDVRSLAIHPASTTHSQLTPEEQTTTGVSPDLVRLCVGIESIDDILADLEVGFRAAKGA